MVEVKLLPIEKKDLESLQIWRNSEIVMPFCRQYRPISMKHMENWYEKLHTDKDFNLANDLFKIELHMLDEFVHFGVGGFVRIDWRNRKAELSFYVGNNSYNIETYIIKSISKLLDYAFKTLNMHKVYFPVYSFNPKLEVYKKILKVEYVAKEEYFWNGQYHDRIILVSYGI